ncbi:MAG: carboxylesterase [Betaproteobacteria bacterium]|nr:carboxylesterase [Betaproteobacteria bacterium]
MLDAIELETDPHPEATVIWLHGLGADGGDFVPVVGELGVADLPVRFLFPHAPVIPVTINGGHEMRAWYDILEANLDRRVDADGVRRSCAQVEALIARESGHGIPPARIVLAGFSQGGAIALHAALARAVPLAGVVALSTYAPLPDTLTALGSPALRTMPLFMAHGTHDAIVPVALGRRAAEGVRTLGLDVAWHEYPMDHEVCMEEIRAIGGFLRTVLDPAPRPGRP